MIKMAGETRTPHTHITAGRGESLVVSGVHVRPRGNERLASFDVVASSGVYQRRPLAAAGRNMNANTSQQRNDKKRRSM